MKGVYKKIILTFLISFGIGGGAILLVASSDNGYVAGFVFLPLFFLIGISSLILFIVGFILLGSNNKSAPWILLSAILVPVCFISSGLIAKYFEIGAYREEPMTPISDGVNNVVVFKEETTNDQINKFWEKTMSLELADGRGYDHLPGVGTMMRIQAQNGREAIAFGFFSHATEEQKQFVFAKVKSSPIVYQLLKNQSMKELNVNSDNSSPSSNSNMPVNKVAVTKSMNSK